MLDVADLTQSIAGFEDSIRKCKAMLFHVCVMCIHICV